MDFLTLAYVVLFAAFADPPLVIEIVTSLKNTEFICIAKLFFRFQEQGCCIPAPALENIDRSRFAYEPSL